MFPLSRRVSLKPLSTNCSHAVSAEAGRTPASQLTVPSVANVSSAYSSSVLSQNCCSPSAPNHSQIFLLHSNSLELKLLFHQSQDRAMRNNPLKSQWTTIRRAYFTNANVTKDKDPYAILGLQWGDGATTAEIKQAFRLKARELHPDLNTTDTRELAQLKFQRLVKAFETLVPPKGSKNDANSLEDWRVAVWRQSDRIAMDRTDVAGQARIRPAPPAKTLRHQYHSRELGHPQGAKATGEYLEATPSGSNTNKRKSSSVGTGRSKWVKPKEFIPWNPNENEAKKVK